MAENNSENGIEQASLSLDRPGDKLRMGREASGLSLADVAAKTRVPLRHLAALETNDYASLPGPTYCIGFSRAYARAVGLDEVAIAAEVRAELEGSDAIAPRVYESFEPADPARVPPRMLAWTAAAIALLIAIGYGVWRTEFFTAPTDSEIADTANASMAAAPARAIAPMSAPDTAGPVVLTAMEDVWIRIYDAVGTRLLEKTMMKGESYTVPANANGPMILTGRPDSLAVTVAGKPVAPLGPPDRSVSDLPISAAALLSRPGVSAPTQETGGTSAGASTSTASSSGNTPSRSDTSEGAATTQTTRPARTTPRRETTPETSGDTPVSSTPAPPPAQTPADSGATPPD